VLVIAAGVAGLDRPSLLDEEGVELTCPGGDREDLEVADEDPLERQGVVVEHDGASGVFARLREHAADCELADRRPGELLCPRQQRTVPGGLVKLREPGQDDALVVSPGDARVISAVVVEAVIHEVTIVDQSAVVEPRPFGLSPP